MEAVARGHVPNGRYTGAVQSLRPRHMECLQAQECGACRMRDAAKRANSVLHAAPDGEERAPAALQGRPLRCPVVPASPSPATGSVEGMLGDDGVCLDPTKILNFSSHQNHIETLNITNDSCMEY